jgi:hypothetical protein
MVVEAAFSRSFYVGVFGSPVALGNFSKKLTHFRCASLTLLKRAGAHPLQICDCLMDKGNPRKAVLETAMGLPG